MGLSVDEITAAIIFPKGPFSIFLLAEAAGKHVNIAVSVQITEIAS